MKLLLTKKFVFEMAHALEGYDGKCAHLHGHSYHLEVTVEGSEVGPDGMTLDYSQLKHIVQRNGKLAIKSFDRFDHALVLHQDSNLRPPASDLHNLIPVPFNPTTENLLLHFASLLQPLMPQGARLHSLRLAETDTSVAELVL